MPSHGGSPRPTSDDQDLFIEELNPDNREAIPHTRRLQELRDPPFHYRDQGFRTGHPDPALDRQWPCSSRNTVRSCDHHAAGSRHGTQLDRSQPAGHLDVRRNRADVCNLCRRRAGGLKGVCCAIAKPHRDRRRQHRDETGRRHASTRRGASKPGPPSVAGLALREPLARRVSRRLQPGFPEPHGRHRRQHQQQDRRPPLPAPCQL